MSAPRSHYEMLGVSPDADVDEIHRAYLVLARRHHPDAGGDPADMRRLNEAWGVLSDRRRRRRYDDLIGLTTPSTAAWPVASSDVDAEPGPRYHDDDDVRDLFAEEPSRRPPSRRQRLADSLTLLAVMFWMALAAVSFLFGMMLESGPLLGFGVFSLFLTGIFVVARTLLAMRFDARSTT